MDNQLPNEFNGKGKTGRFWLSPYHLMEAKHNLEIANSKVKRGEIEPLKDFKQHAWGCGCCVCVLDAPRREEFDYPKLQAAHVTRVYQKRSGRRYTFHELNGRRLSRVELPNGQFLPL